MTPETGWFVHYLSEDPQGGYWPVSPRGPFTLDTAKCVRDRMSKRSDCRNVKIKFRIDIEVPGI